MCHGHHVDVKKEPEPKKDLEHYVREISSHIDDQKWVYALSHGKKLRDKTAAAVKSYTPYKIIPNTNP